MDEEIQNPHARRALSEAHERLDRMSHMQSGLDQERDRLGEALGNPDLAAALNDFLDNLGGAVQDHVHTSRAQLADIADMQLREEQTGRHQRGPAPDAPAQDGSAEDSAPDGDVQSGSGANGERPPETGKT